jgi:voltage-gated potassium channel
MGTVDLRSLRVLRLFRVFRVLKLGRYSSALQSLGNALRKCAPELSVTGFAALMVGTPGMAIDL